MKNYKLISIFFVLSLALFFSIEHLGVFRRTDIHFSKLIYPLGIFFIVIQILSERVRSFPVYVTMGLCGVGYVGCRLMMGSPEEEWHDIQILVTLVEFFLLIFIVYIGNIFANLGGELEKTLEDLIISTDENRMNLYENGNRKIAQELDRSRRYNHPFSIVMVEPERFSYKNAMEGANLEIQQSLTDKYLFNKLGKVIDSTSRDSDCVVSYKDNNRFLIICPETTETPVENLITRLHRAAERQLGIKLISGKATFPSESVTLDELINKANSPLSGYLPDQENNIKELSASAERFYT